MIYALGDWLHNYYGPARLLTSHLNLIILGMIGGFIGVVRLVPALLERLPRDRGREFAVEAGNSVGKPTGAGVVFVPIFLLVAVLVVPPDTEVVVFLALTLVTMISGFLDDRSSRAWSGLLKGIVDLVPAVAAAFLLYGSEMRIIWVPFTNSVLHVPMWAYVPLVTALLWVSINTTNCSDGVDGLSSTLVIIALICVGAFLYTVVGHTDISSYLLVPHYADSAKWAIVSFTLVGALAGYLWYNAYPSHVLMGDAGSRPLGFALGFMIMRTGNPFLILIVCSVILINGGTGLVKLALLRFFNIRIFHTVRFPLHDHFRNHLKWSNTQVLIRFSLL